ncbi:uncharacterized protein FIESC28_03889 [Fusarium coffeatum]|uniref:Uncharacterized protein n=1 Tax=Fusarium coffeatum TaxID=231269 RepID=A0A366S3H2_9HYPO|nr:uncharacterized protein FIESC28_03889 [Fusarium coffeatum]RBR23306.1 hypothetical protein FIESC28_03889 [Fusarium coffeatum]
MDSHRRYSDQSRQPRTDVVYGDSQNILQARRPVPSSQGTFQPPPGHPRMQQTYFTQEYQGTPSHQYAQGYSYAPSTQLAYQGSAGSQQYDDSSNAHNRVNFPGDRYSWDDTSRRTASFVGSGYNPGARYAQHAEESERYGASDADGTIKRFDSQFPEFTSHYVIPHNAQQGGTPWTYPRRIDPGYRDYHQTTEQPSRDGRSSWKQQ